METIEITLGLLLAVAAVGAVGRWIALPLPILLVGAGVALSFVPAFSGLRIDPSVFFMLFIPPLLFADGWLIPKRDLLSVLRPVLLLAFGLVLLTVIVVGYLMHALIPGLPLAVAFALGAVISPTDAVAVSATTKKLKVPSRVTNILKGESLINDASGLVAFTFAVAAVSSGTFDWRDATLQFLVLSVGGFVVGLSVAWVIGHVRLALKRFCVDDPRVQTVISLLTPFAAYIAAERLHLGGILAIVAAGLYAGVHDTRHLDAPTRGHSWEVWLMVLFAFNGLVFLLLGLQLRSVLARVPAEDAGAIALYALVLCAAVIAIRMLWVFPATYIPPFVSKRIREREGIHHPKPVFLVGWAGIRGSVTLAAALSLPLTTTDGSPFPGRDLVILLASAVIVFTLLVNGLTLPALIRGLGIRGDGAAEREERAARIAVAQAAVEALQRTLPTLHSAEETAYAQRLIGEYERRMHEETANAERRHQLDVVRASEQRLRLVALRAERDELMQMRDTDLINDEVLRLVQAELDHAESSAADSAPRQPAMRAAD